MSYRVEVLEPLTEEPLGFLMTEDDENPNNVERVASFDTLEDVRQAIGESIAAGRPMDYLVEDESGEHIGVAYADGEVWHYELPED